MDEILASIRKIINEEPIAARHRPGGGEGVPVSLRRSKSLPAVRAAEPKLELAINSTQSASRRTRPVPEHDDVLAELLAPSPESAVAPIEKAAIETPRVPSEPAIEIAEMPSEAVAPAATAIPASPVESIASRTPQDEVQTAENVLGALAAGLAAASVVPVDEIVVQAPSGATAIEAAEAKGTIAEIGINAAPINEADSLTPEAAAAAAVAEVVAANAIAAHARSEAQEPVLSSLASAEVLPPSPADVSEDSSDPVAAAELVQKQPAPVIAELVTPEIATPTSSIETMPVPSVPATDLVPVAAQSFEDTIAGMLRPLLREWFNANMPRMVEKALKEELAAPTALMAQALPRASSAA